MNKAFYWRNSNLPVLQILFHWKNKPAPIVVLSRPVYSTGELSNSSIQGIFVLLSVQPPWIAWSVLSTVCQQ